MIQILMWKQLRTSSLYFGSPKQLTFTSDKEEEKGKKGSKNSNQ